MANSAADAKRVVALQLTEVVLKTARYDEMASFYTHLLGHGPFYQRTPDPDAPPALPVCRNGGVSSLSELIAQYERMTTQGARPHRAANHGQATSFYFRDPDRNIVEFSCPNFATTEEEEAFMAGPVFAANPSGLELDPERFVARFQSGDSKAELLRLDNTLVAL